MKVRGQVCVETLSERFDLTSWSFWRLQGVCCWIIIPTLYNLRWYTPLKLFNVMHASIYNRTHIQYNNIAWHLSYPCEWRFTPCTYCHYPMKTMHAITCFSIWNVHVLFSLRHSEAEHMLCYIMYVVRIEDRLCDIQVKTGQPPVLYVIRAKNMHIHVKIVTWIYIK